MVVCLPSACRNPVPESRTNDTRQTKSESIAALSYSRLASQQAASLKELLQSSLEEKNKHLIGWRRLSRHAQLERNGLLAPGEPQTPVTSAGPGCGVCDQAACQWEMPRLIRRKTGAAANVTDILLCM